MSLIFAELTNLQAEKVLDGLVGNPKWDTSDGLCGVADLMGGGRAYMAIEGGENLGAFIIQKVTRQNGRELEIRAGWQLSSRGNLSEQIIPEIERRWGYDCDVVTIYTRRPGLVRKLERMGFNQSAVILTKKIQGA